MELVDQYIYGYGKVPADVDLFTSLLSDDFEGVLIRNGDKLTVNKQDYIEFIREHHFDKCVKTDFHHKSITMIGPFTYVAEVRSIQQSENKRGEVFDSQKYVVDENTGKFKYIRHNWTVTVS